MKGNQKILETLNMLLADELNRHQPSIWCNPRCCADWGYEKTARGHREARH